MAIVADVGGTGTVDKKLSTPNRRIAGTPYGVLTPEYAGEVVLDYTGMQLWTTSGGLSNTTWVPITKVT